MRKWPSWTRWRSTASGRSPSESGSTADPPWPLRGGGTTVRADDGPAGRRTVAAARWWPVLLEPVRLRPGSHGAGRPGALPLGRQAEQPVATTPSVVQGEDRCLHRRLVHDGYLGLQLHRGLRRLLLLGPHGPAPPLDHG